MSKTCIVVLPSETLLAIALKMLLLLAFLATLFAEQMIMDMNQSYDFKPMMVVHAPSKTKMVLKTSQLNHFEFNEDNMVHTLDQAPDLTPIKFTKFDNRTVPDFKDKDTIVGMAKMSWKAYYEPKNNDGLGWGWKSPGLRGYVFVPSWVETQNALEDDSHTYTDVNDVIIAVKGTSFSLFGGREGDLDKRNDNLLFSCCCAHIDKSWKDICDCANGNNMCNEQCIHKEVMGCAYPGCSCPLGTCKRSYFNAAQDILRTVKKKFPNARIHTTGHSLGGAMATILLHMVYADPTTIERGGGSFTFESPAQRLTLHRLGLLFPAPVFNFGNSADPIFTGECIGKSSSCYIFGYAMETKCHSGFVCEYMTRKDAPPPRPMNVVENYDDNLGFTEDMPFYSINAVADNWRLSILHHRIIPLIKDVLQVYPVPECVQPIDCRDCEEWQFK